MSDPAVLIDRARTGFLREFGSNADFVAYAPGRVNLIGEHTDYNDGFVLPCAIPFGTAVAFGRRSDSTVEAVALDLEGAMDCFALEPELAPRSAGDWANHVRGISAALLRDCTASGCNLAITGNVPQGAGLSSSASLGVALALGMTELAGGAADPAKLARMAQWSEHEFVGCACGIMDQLASAGGVDGSALLIDCRSLATEPVSIPQDAAIVIVHSGVRRGLVGSAYNERRQQCEAAARHYGVAALRDLDLTTLAAARGRLDPVAFRRARHVVTENARTVTASQVLAAGNLARFGALMRESHVSLRNDFEVTVAPVDDLVELMGNVVGEAGGVRMTGGGFGGCVVAILPQAGVAELELAVTTWHQRADDQPPLFMTVRPTAGAKLFG